MASKIVSSGYEPVNCVVSSGKRVAIIVPFRDDGSKGTIKLRQVSFKMVANLKLSR